VHNFRLFVLSIFFYHITIMYKALAVLKALNMSCPNNISLDVLKSRPANIGTITTEKCFFFSKREFDSEFRTAC